MATKDTKEHKHPQGEMEKQPGPPVTEMLLPGTEMPEEKEEKLTDHEFGLREAAKEEEKWTEFAEVGAKVATGVGVGLQLSTAHEMIAELRAELIGEIGRVRDQLRSEMIDERGLKLQMVGGMFNCPTCGIRLDSPALSGMKGGMYEHGFQTSPQLGGVQCKYKGRKFKPPVVFLEFADLPLTTKTE